jgi:formamidopyrimidine-DNA glycosylase
MPELPDVTVYVECLRARVTGEVLERVRLASPFLLRTVDPPLSEAEGKRVLGVRRLSKRIVICLDAELFLAFHLMIAGRLHWYERGAKVPGSGSLVAVDFSSGTLMVTEAGTKKRASLHLLRGDAALAALHAGGLEVLETDENGFRTALVRENHTLKRQSRARQQTMCSPLGPSSVVGMPDGPVAVSEHVRVRRETVRGCGRRGRRRRR